MFIYDPCPTSMFKSYNSTMLPYATFENTWENTLVILLFCLLYCFDETFLWMLMLLYLLVSANAALNWDFSHRALRMEEWKVRLVRGMDCFLKMNHLTVSDNHSRRFSHLLVCSWHRLCIRYLEYIQSMHQTKPIQTLGENAALK